LPITRKLDDCIDAENIFCVSLTAEETARFLDKYKAKVQLRGQHQNGTVFGGKPVPFTVYPMADEILKDDLLPDTGDIDIVILDGDVIVSEEEAGI
jgi:hypothetical protein